jgi:hypothetical protein
MISGLESELIRTLSAAADAAPDAATTFADEVRDRQHRRERRRTRLVVAAAAATVVAVTLSVLGVVARTTAQPQPPGSPTGPALAPYTRSPRLADARPAEQLWPEALVTLPARLPDGRAYTLTTILGDGRFLVAPNHIVDRYNASAEVLLWEPDRGSVRTVGDPPVVPGIVTTTMWGLPGFGDGFVAWIVRGERDQSAGVPDRGSYQEIWAVPLAGGAARRLAVIEGAMVAPMVHIVAGQVYWASESSYLDSPMLFRVPVTGGDTAEVPGSRGYALTPTAPWAWTWGNDSNRSELWNLADGTRRAIAHDDLFEFECSPSWCVGQVSGGSRWLARRLDGSGTLRPDFEARFITTANENIVIGTRFEQPTDSRVVWDLRTGELGTGPGYNADPTTSHAQSMLSWLNQDGTMTVLDPRAIR